MKILSVSGSLGDNAYSWRIYNIAKLLQSGGHEVDFVQYARTPISQEQGLSCAVYSNLNSSVVRTALPMIPVKNLRMVSNNNYDLIWGNTYLGTFYSLSGKLKKVPVIFDMHGSVIEERKLLYQSSPFLERTLAKPGSFLRSIIERIDLSFSDKIICVSNKMIDYLHEKFRVPLEKMSYITNGVDLNFFQPMDLQYSQKLREQLNLNNKFVFGYAGGLSKWQGIESFIAAAKAIKDNQTAFVIIGGEDRRNEGNLYFIPRVPQAQIIQYYSMCDILVLPRPNHPATEIAAPTKFAEYTAMGKPILMTNVGDAADFVDKYKCGVIVKNNSINALVEGILEIRAKSSAQLQEMARNSRILAENEFDWNKNKIGLLETVKSIK